MRGHEGRSAWRGIVDFFVRMVRRPIRIDGMMLLSARIACKQIGSFDLDKKDLSFGGC